MDTILTDNQLLTPIRDGEKILRDDPFVVINGQTLFLHRETNTVVFTLITEDKEFTEADYMSLPENAPYQLINGKLIYMSAPIVNHQKIVVRLITCIFNYVDEKKLGEGVKELRREDARPGQFQPDQRHRHQGHDQGVAADRRLRFSAHGSPLGRFDPMCHR